MFRSWQLEKSQRTFAPQEIALQILTRKLLQILSGPTQSSLSIISLQVLHNNKRAELNLMFVISQKHSKNPSVSFAEFAANISACNGLKEIITTGLRGQGVRESREIRAEGSALGTDRSMVRRRNGLFSGREL